jgi:hypothetical protein
VEGGLLSWEVGRRKGSVATRAHSIREIEKAIEARSSSKVPPYVSIASRSRIPKKIQHPPCMLL